MTGHRAVFGFCILCAMASSAIAAQGAVAAGGQTAYTCSAIALTEDFSSEHCVPGEAGTTFGHVSIFETTHAKFSNEKTNATTTGPTNWLFKETIAATNFELESTGAVEGLGELKNEKIATEMQASGETDVNGITFNGVIVKAPAGKGCEVFTNAGGAKGVVDTKPLKGHTTARTDKENGEGASESRDSVTIEPQAAGSTVLATFFIECTGNVPPALKGNWTIEGTLTCPTHGATISCNHTTITEQGALIGKGATAGLTGKSTITAGEFPVTQPTHPISVTTTP